LRQQKYTSHFFIASRSVLGPNQPHFHLISTLRMIGALHLLCYVPSWPRRGQVYFFSFTSLQLTDSIYGYNWLRQHNFWYSRLRCLLEKCCNVNGSDAVMLCTTYGWPIKFCILFYLLDKVLLNWSVWKYSRRQFWRKFNEYS